MKRTLIVVLLAILLSGCPAPQVKQDDIRVYQADNWAVTCWIFINGYAGGISCLPETQLEIRE